MECWISSTMSGPQWQREVRRGSYDGNTTTKNPFKHLAHRRGSAPSLVFSKALSKPRSSAVRNSTLVTAICGSDYSLLC
ncbi:T-cell activation Rho GTPase-activating protein isoform C [Alligator mississippiensis]|uniref:T-cell activation Rho GTPase-activating protein isoform C n=1 Tax=Alligator mississippiensis TaxID=8496 RepID=A0A151M2A5_ALLMI|nr:T-cell activation Rho GTPase-activating protein isoform C [Alligator mississippiensis]